MTVWGDAFDGATAKLKFSLLKNTGGTWGLDPRDDGADITVLRSTEQTHDGKWRIRDPALRSLSAKEYQSTKLEEGDLLVTKSSGSESHIGKATLVDTATAGMSYSNFMQRLRVGSSCQPKYYWYFLNSHIAREQYNYFSNSTSGLGNLSSQIFADLEVPELTGKIQKKIADFLDTETAQIDNLIAKQERLLELLEEKRRATITHAVTRGLNPSVELKETNIPWLAQIPAHWSVVRVKDIANIVLGKMVQNEQKNTEEVLKPYLKSRNIQWSGIDLSSVDEMWFKPNEIQSYSLLDDDIVVSEGGDVGKCVMWREEFGEMYFQNSVNRVRVAENTEAKYVYYVFQHFALNQVFMNTVNKVSIAHLTKDKIATYHIPMPNEAEQGRIADYLDTEDTKFRELKQKIQTQITLLRERRTSLISHAVTGKIKI